MTQFKPAPIKPFVGLEDFSRLDIRVGTILKVEEIPKSDKLLRLIVDLGDHQRTILAGMKQERDDPKEVEGVQALFLVNLEPKKMMGQVSQGMIIDLGYEDGLTPVLAVPEKQIPNGIRLG
jgi:tRNA-binding protein